jgi:hypothetical protein
MFDQVHSVTEVEAVPAPLPGTKGQVTMQVLNGDLSQGPVLLRQRGDGIPCRRRVKRDARSHAWAAHDQHWRDVPGHVHRQRRLRRLPSGRRRSLDTILNVKP